MPLPPSYRSLLTLSDDRIISLDASQPIPLERFDCGVLFVFAPWSGTDQVAFRALSQVINDFALQITLYLVEADDVDVAHWLTRFPEVPHGHGETYWIANGQVMCHLARYSGDALDVLRNHMRNVIELRNPTPAID